MEKALKETLEGGKFGNVSAVHSKRMSAVRSRGNKTTEISLRLGLARAGIKGWKIHAPGLVGNPDFYFPKKKLAIFVDGCFWHGCPRCGHVPSMNNQYWSTKISRNRERDGAKSRALRKAGITVIRFWEHELKADLPQCVARIKRGLSNRAFLGNEDARQNLRGYDS